MTAQAIDIQIADAVLAELEDAEEGTFSQAFEAERVYMAMPDLKDLKTIRLSIMPESVADTQEARAFIRGEIPIQIGVRKKLAAKAGESAELAELDGLRLFCQEILRYLEGRALAGATMAQWVSAENKPLWVQEHIRELRQFTSVITIVYRALRAQG